MGFESPNKSLQEKNELTFDSIDVPGQKPYKTGDFVSVLRSSGEIEGGWIIEDIDAEGVTCVGSTDGGLARKTMNLDTFKNIQIKAGDKRSRARLVDRQLEQIRAGISIRKEIKRLEAVKIDSVQSAEEFLQSDGGAYRFRKGDSYDYRALWEFGYENLKNKIKDFREKFGEDSAPFNLIALIMRKMNEVRRLLWPTDLKK